VTALAKHRIVGEINTTGSANIVILVLGLVLFAGCSSRSPELPPSRLMQRPDSALNELDLRLKTLSPVGNTMPVLVTVANITLKSLSLRADKISATLTTGESVPVIPLPQAEQAAGGVDRLATALPNLNPVYVPPPAPPESAGQGIAEFCFGPLANLSSGEEEFGAAWLMFICPAFAGAFLVYSAMPKSNKPPPIAARDLNADLLPNGDLPSGRDIRGYIFLPPGNYQTIEVPITDSASGFTTTVVEQWGE